MAFLDIILAFPTAIYTALFGLALLYWAMVIIGLLDLDMFDFDLDFEVDVDLDVDVDVDVDVDADVDAPASSPGFLVTVLSALGIGKVPFMIIYTAVIFIAWVIAYMGASMLLPFLGNPGWAQALVLAGAFLCALPLSTIFTRPLKDVFEVTVKDSGEKLVGQSVIIQTSTVDSKFGTAIMDDGAAGLRINVRCDVENNGLKKGSEALIIGFDDDKNHYHVEPMHNLLPSSDDEDDDIAEQEAQAQIAEEVAQTVESGG